MKILVIDRDNLSTQLIRSKLEGMGHMVVEEPVKNNAIEMLETNEFDTVFFDPSPLSNARPVVLGIRRTAKNYPYIVLTSQDMGHDEALKSGANDILMKPLDAMILDQKVANALRLNNLIARVGDESEDFPSAGGVIAKSAFNQLFLSSIDRADRYAERSYMVFIGIENYTEIVQLDGPSAATYSAAQLSQYLVRLRRQSDIIAQTGKAEFCIMLQRPLYETEPMEATSRFTEAISKLQNITESGTAQINVHVSLLEVPSGKEHLRNVIEFDKAGAQKISKA